MKSTLYLLLIAFALFLAPGHLEAIESPWGPFGMRGGFAADGKDNGVTQYEAFGFYRLPWARRNGSGWGVSSRLGLTAGVLRSQGEYGFIASLGPSLGLGKPTFPLELDLGISAAVLSRDKFGTRDYNGYGQFISHIGTIYRICPNFGLSYRFQHMSNAGLNGSQNPGLNMHLFDASWYFTR